MPLSSAISIQKKFSQVDSVLNTEGGLCYALSQ